MTEQTGFHADIRRQPRRDVINELAGHELAHLWWGNNRIAPDEREGSILLTETLAMYTELMLYKQRHGIAAMKEVVEMHRSLYENGRVHSKEEPLYKVSPGNAYLAYHKGLVVMYQLYDLMGEERINKALRRLLEQHAYPQPPPVSLDLVRVLQEAAEPAHRESIRQLFME